MPDGGQLSLTTANVEIDAAEARRRADASPGAYVMIAVGDTGTGMPAAIVERAFDPFFTTKEVGKGTGLGLSQLYGFIRQSGGHVTIDSQVGRGTIVRLFLPRHTGEATTADVPGEASPEVPQSRAETVLVVEDEPNVRIMSVEALRELGYDVVQADGPHEALRLLEVQPAIDLIFTDIVMPDMDGRELADAARAMRPGIKVVYTTGYARGSATADGLPESAYLPKPFTLAALATKVRDALDASPPARA
jgi:CheY-like chemotaxis protein